MFLPKQKISYAFPLFQNERLVRAKVLSLTTLATDFVPLQSIARLINTAERALSTHLHSLTQQRQQQHRQHNNNNSNNNKNES